MIKKDEYIKKLERRIHNQRIALRYNQLIIEERKNIMQPWKFKNGSVIHWDDSGKHEKYEGSEHSFVFYVPESWLSQITSRFTLTAKVVRFFYKFVNRVRFCSR